MLRHSLMHHNKTSQYTFVQTHCHPHANIDNHFAIHKYQAKKIKQLLIFAVLPRQAPRPDREQRLSEALTTPQTRHQSAPSGPGAADLRDADSSTHSILSISSPQFSTARRAAAPGPVAPSAITASLAPSLAQNLTQSDAKPPSFPIARSPLRLRAPPREAKVSEHPETSRRAAPSRRGLRVSVSASAVSVRVPPSAGHELLPAAYIDAARNRRVYTTAHNIINSIFIQTDRAVIAHSAH